MSASASQATIDVPALPLSPVSPRGLASSERGPEDGRRILYERLTGAAARERAQRPAPQGAGLSPDIAREIEYLEVWVSTDVSRGWDFRMYSFGGVLVAFRSS